MGLLQLLLKDYMKEKENQRFKRRLARNFPAGQTMRITANKDDAEECNKEQNTQTKEKQREAAPPQHQKEKESGPDTMLEYAESGQLDKDLFDYNQHQFIEESFCQASAWCMHYDMECQRQGDFLYVTTQAGKWYFRPSQGPITLYHQNYELRRNQAETYHVQFTRKCSIQSLLWYIYKHDRKKLLRERRNKRSPI